MAHDLAGKVHRMPRNRPIGRMGIDVGAIVERLDAKGRELAKLSKDVTTDVVTRRTEGELPPGHSIFNEPKLVKRQVIMATAADNAQILTEIRDIVRTQLQKLKSDGLSQSFTPAQASILHRLTQVYAIMDHHTQAEHRRYDYSGASEEDLKVKEQEARALLAAAGDTSAE